MKEFFFYEIAFMTFWDGRVLYGLCYSWVRSIWGRWFLQFFLPLVLSVFYFKDFFSSFPCCTEPIVSQVISIAVSMFKLFAGGFWGVRTILFTFFTYLFSCASTFRGPKLLAVVAMEGIGNISVDLRYHVPNFKYKWGLRGIEGKDVGVGVNKSVIFSLL